MTQRITKRNTAMTNMWAGGATLAKVGDKFGVSRQRVHQVGKELGFEKWHEQRRAANLELIEKYNSAPTCLCCRAPLKLDESKRFKRLCPPCARRLCLVRQVQWYIRNANVTRTVRGCEIYQYLSSATHLIRKHALKPEDFR